MIRFVGDEPVQKTDRSDSPSAIYHSSCALKLDKPKQLSVSLNCRLAGRLIAEEDLILPGGTSHKWQVSVVADQKANQVTVSAEYTLPGKKKKTEKRQVAIPIKETGAKIEIDTSALDDFEDM